MRLVIIDIEGEATAVILSGILFVVAPTRNVLISVTADAYGFADVNPCTHAPRHATSLVYSDPLAHTALVNTASGRFVTRSVRAA